MIFQNNLILFPRLLMFGELRNEQHLFDTSEVDKIKRLNNLYHWL